MIIVTPFEEAHGTHIVRKFDGWPYCDLLTSGPALDLRVLYGPAQLRLNIQHWRTPQTMSVKRARFLTLPPNSSVHRLALLSRNWSGTRVLKQSQDRCSGVPLVVHLSGGFLKPLHINPSPSTTSVTGVAHHASWCDLFSRRKSHKLVEYLLRLRYFWVACPLRYLWCLCFARYFLAYRNLSHAVVRHRALADAHVVGNPHPSIHLLCKFRFG